MKRDILEPRRSVAPVSRVVSCALDGECVHAGPGGAGGFVRESGRAQPRTRVTARTAEREAARVAVRYGNRHYVRCALYGGCCWSACSIRTAKLLARSSCERNTTRTDVRALVGGQGEGVVTSRVQPAKNLAGLWAVVRRDGCPVPARVCLRYDTGSRPRRLRRDQQHGARLPAQTSGVARLGVCTHARHRQRELARRRRHFAPGSRRSIVLCTATSYGQQCPAAHNPSSSLCSATTPDHVAHLNSWLFRNRPSLSVVNMCPS